LTVVGVQCLDALDRGGGQFASALSARIGGTERQDVIEELFAQIRFDANSDEIGADFIQPCKESAARDDDQDQPKPASDLREVLSLQEGSIDRTAE
jgi:hypothetical protein